MGRHATLKATIASGADRPSGAASAQTAHTLALRRVYAWHSEGRDCRGREVPLALGRRDVETLRDLRVGHDSLRGFSNEPTKMSSIVVSRRPPWRSLSP